jgi:hypothetical protein
MLVQFYAVRVEAEQLVAAEIGDDVVAELLADGQPVVLATEAELDRLSRRLGKTRTVLFRRTTTPTLPGQPGPISSAPAPIEVSVERHGLWSGLLTRLVPGRRLKVA